MEKNSVNKRDVDLIKNIKTLEHIQSLGYNWNGYNASPIPNQLVEKCKDIISTIDIQPEIYPTARDSIQFEWELKDDSYLEFEIYEDKISCLQVPKKNYNIAITFSFPICEYMKINEIVNKFYCQME